MIPETWADDGTTWDTPDVVLSDGPQSVILEDVDRALLEGMPTSGRVGFTAALHPQPIPSERA